MLDPAPVSFLERYASGGNLRQFHPGSSAATSAVPTQWMKACWLCLVLCCLQARANTNSSSFGVNDLHDSAALPGAEFLRDSSRSVGASLRLTAYDLPESVLYYLPSLPGRRAVNQTRPKRNKYPGGWRLLFCPAVVTLSPHRWLVYDGLGHFQAYDDTGPEDYDFYDYDEAHPPPGCTLGIRSGFLENNVPSGVTWEDVPKNKAAFGIIEQALQHCSASASNGCTSLAVLPYVCAAVPATVATSSGSLLAILPTAAIVVGVALLVAAVVVAGFALASGLLMLSRERWCTRASAAQPC